MYIELAFKYWKYHKKRAGFIVLSICLSVAALVSSALLVRSNKLQQLESNLIACGDYDFEFYNVSQKSEEELRADEHFEQFGLIYRCGKAKGQAGESFEVGYIKDGKSEEMFHLTPIMGRYPQKSGEICIDRMTLNSMGYAAELGQEIELTCMDWDQNDLRKNSFMVVGIIEQRIKDEGLGTEYIQRQFSGIYDEGTVTVDAPFAYMCVKDAVAIYKDGFQKILLANVKVTDTFDDQDMKAVLNEKFRNENGEWTGEFLYNGNKVNTRSWMANCLLGFKNMDTNNLWGYHAAQERIKSDTTQKDFYSAVLIPIFFLLIVIITFISLYNAINMTFSDRIRQNGMFRCLGMSVRNCQIHLVLEIGVLLVPGILGGYSLGYLIYASVQQVQKKVFGIQVIGAGDVSDYFRPYVEASTFNPNLLPLVAIVIALIPAVILPAIRNGRVSPVAACAIRNRLYKKQRRFSVLVYVNIIVVMVAAVFGYSYFCMDNDNKNHVYQTQLESANLVGWDYFMEQNKIYTVKGYGSEIRHDTGISKEDLDKIRTLDIVEQSEATIINLSTRIAVENAEENQLVMDSLAGSYVMDTTGVATTPELEKIYEIRNQREMEYRGYDEKEMVYEVPSIGLEDHTWEKLEQYVVEGNINLDKIKAGEEVVLVVSDVQSSRYHVGDKLPLSDDVYPKEQDTSGDYQSDICPKSWEPTYKAEGDNWPQYCFAKRTRLDTSVGAVMVLDDENIQQRYFCDENGVFAWNIFVSPETFQNWNLPDERYSRLWVKCKDGADKAEFERFWYRIVTDGQVMKSYIAQDILDEISKTNRNGMSLFFAMLLMIIVVTLVGVVNSFSMGISMERKRLNLLRAMGAARGWIIGKQCLNNLWIILMGGVLSVVPVYAFDRIAKLATTLVEEAWKNGIPLPDDHWAKRFAGYLLMQYHPQMAAVVVTMVALLLTTMLIGICMKKELEHSIVDGIRDSE